MLTGIKGAAVALLVFALPVDAPQLERRRIPIECEEGADGRCLIGKRDLAGIVGAAEALMKEAQQLRRDVDELRERCPKSQDDGPANWPNQERRT